MRKTSLKNCLQAAAAAALLISALPFIARAAEADGARIPDELIVAPALKADRMAGKFTAKIMPRAGYHGPLFIGHLPARKLVQEAPRNTNNAHAFYPDDIGYYGGPLVTKAGVVNTYWGESNGTTWGNPATYENDLNKSTMVKMLDYYTGNTYNTNNYYPALGIYWYGGTVGTLVYDSQVATLVQNEATYDRSKRGQSLNYSNIYHVFLPPGTDECFDNPANGCYNPDGAAPGPFAFCGYHSYTQLTDGTVVLYTVEPYETVSGCSAGFGTPNDTANVLGHETAETITDPVPGSGWVGEWPSNSGTEVADICAWVEYTQSLAGGGTFVTQDWYSDKYHACANVQ